MKSFGAGFVRSCASIEEYKHFVTSHYHFYSALEHGFAEQADGQPMHAIWTAFPDLFGAPKKLAKDLEAVGFDVTDAPRSSATNKYIDAIREASCVHDGVGLVGHFYCRYFADLFGGSMLGKPTNLALNLPEESPSFYRFPSAIENHRADYIEHVYEKMNEEGEKMGEERRQETVSACVRAFTLNSDLYLERPNLYFGALRGTINIASGYVKSQLH
jgi:heme oxygenase